MGESILLKAELRSEENGTAKNIRQQGFLPAIVYGKNKESRNIKIETAIFEKVFSKAGESTLVDLEIAGGETIKTLIYDVQKDPVKGRIIHVDFYQVDMKEKITTEIPLNFIGESKAIELLSGALVKNITEIEIECLPNDLVTSLDVDISVLETFDDVIKVSDIKFPKGMESTLGAEEVIALVMAPSHETEIVKEAVVEEVKTEVSAEKDVKSAN